MLVAEALAALEVDTLLLGLPDRCLPSEPDEDTGAGSLASRGGERTLAWVRALGFTGVQLGPQGDAGENTSPYDGAAFSRSPLGLAAARLATAEWAGLVSPDAVADVVAARPAGREDRIRFAHARAAHLRLLAESHRAFAVRRAARDGGVAELAARFDAFAARARWWLDGDARHETDGSSDAISRYEFAQLVLHEQHAAARARAHALGLEVWGDLPVGLAARDVAPRRALFLDGYRLGAPPSRTNPDGQPWGYPVLDPSRGTARGAFVAARFAKFFDEYDGVRLDHPHGLVCPWVYRTGTGDDVAAVGAGARLLESPDLPDHPALAAFAIPRREQLNPDPATRRHADDWVVDLDDAQVDRYGELIGAVLEAARAHGRDASALACEVLSTCPYPLARVLARHGLGRFRVTQKIDLSDPADPYRSEHAAPADWIMVGTHDTPPVWVMVDRWAAEGRLGARAAYLATRLAPSPAGEAALARRLAADPGLLAQALFADLFASRARRVYVFLSDALGLVDLYNRPGRVHEDNWTLRLAPDHRARFRARLAADRALNLPCALAMALRARGATATGDRADLVRRLDADAAAWRAGAAPG